MQVASDYIHLDHTPEIILLQEVGSTNSVSSVYGDSVEVRSGEGREVSLGLEQDLHNFRVFCGTNDSHLAQVIAIDADVVERIHFMHCCKRFMAVGFLCSLTHRNLMVVSLHLPHSGNSEDEFMFACNELSAFITQYSRYDFLLGGEWNCEQGDERFDIASIPLTLLGASFHCATEPTRFGRHVNRSIDFFALQGAGFSTLDEGGQLLHVDPPEVVRQSRKSIGSDHECVLLNCAFCVTDSTHGQRLQRPRKVNPCKRSLVNFNKLQESLPQLPPFHQLDIGQQWSALLGLAHQVSFQRPSMKYRDSHWLKGLCQQRRVCSDPAQRLSLTRHILAQRQLEREAWCKGLLVMAAEGNFDSIRQLLQQHHSRRVNVDDAIGHYATQHNFVEAVHSHFSSKFGARANTCDCQEEVPHQGMSFPEATPFNEDEVTQCACRMKGNKTSGPSGMTTDFIKALIMTPQGTSLLTHHLNEMLQGQPLDVHRLAYLVLLPKETRIALPKHYRPIALMEVLHKLYMKLLTERVQSTWPEPLRRISWQSGS